MGEPAVSLTYDDNGNTATRLENGVTTTYSWDMDDKMTGLTTSDSSQSAAHVYAYNGDRLQRTLNGTTWSYLYSKEDILKVAQPGGSLYITQGPGIDDVLAETLDGTPTYAYKNMLSSVVSLADSTGLVTRFYPYGAWGNTNTWPDPATDPNPYGYTGREWDTQGLYYYRNRFYRPELGRLVAMDPLYAAMQYSYVGNSPLGNIDPTGLLVQECCRPAEIPFGGWLHKHGADHCWLQTDTKSAGMGPMFPIFAWLPVLGQPTEVIPHPRVGPDSCTPLTCIDETCVNNQLIIGRFTGFWSGTNNCQTFVDDVVERCKNQCCSEAGAAGGRGL